jgi:putative transcriptional regulator
VLEDLEHNNFFDKLQIPNEKLQKAMLLFSEPLLPDPNFSRTVVYLVNHNNEGSVGLILNKPTGLKLTDVLDIDIPTDFPLFMGGPVEAYGLFYLHTLGNQISGAAEVEKGIYWGSDFEELKKMIQMGSVKESEVKFFSGYSGWGAGQLDDELEEKSWLVKSRGDLNPLGNLSKKSWNKFLKAYGGKHKMLAAFPEDPSHN